MIYLILSILCSTLVMLVFKWAEKFQVNRLQLIVVNYFVAFISGYLVFYDSIPAQHIPLKPWFWYAIFLGVVFISCFNIIGYAIQKIGVGIITVANKMSMVLPVLFSIVIVKEGLSIVSGIGIFLALFAVYLSSVRNNGIKDGFSYWKLPIIVFLISGFVDTYIKFMQTYHVPDEEFGIFCSLVFLFAGIIGLPFFFYLQFSKKSGSLNKTILSGLLLGIPNFGSLFFLMKALNSPNWDSSVLFPINHIGVVLLATFAGVFFFQENLSRTNKIGVSLAVLAIIILSTNGG